MCKLKTTQLYSYNCIKCGREIKQQDILLDIVPMIACKQDDSVFTTGKLKDYHLYVEKEKLRRSIKKHHGLLLSEVLGFMLDERNRDRFGLETKPKTKANLLEAASKILNSSEDKPPKDDSTQISEEFHEIITATKNVFLELKEKRDWIMQFKGAIEFSAENGYKFTDKKNRCHIPPVQVTVCPHCFKWVPPEAFTCEQRMIGFAGKANAGKTTAMLALTYSLEKQAVTNGFYMLYYDEQNKNDFKRNQKLYQAGYKVEKTAISIKNAFNTSFIFKNKSGKPIIYTFVDVPGEIYGQRFEEADVENNYPALKSCRLYIICSDRDCNPAELNKIVGSFLEFLERICTHIPPMLCLATKIDDFDNDNNGDTTAKKKEEDKEKEKEVEKKDDKKDDKKDVEDELRFHKFKYFEGKFKYLEECKKFVKCGDMKTGFWSLLCRLKSDTFVTPLTCSFYGYSPEDKPREDKSSEVKPSEDKSPEGESPEDKSSEGESPVDKSPEGESPEDKSPVDKSPEDKPSEGESPVDKSPEGESPEDKPSEGESPVDKSPEGESPEDKSPEGESPEDKSSEGESPEDKSSEGESPVDKSPVDKSPEGESPEDKSPEGESPEDKSPEGESPEDKSPEGKSSKEDKTDTSQRLKSDKNPINVDKIFEWVLRMYGDEPVIETGDKKYKASLIDLDYQQNYKVSNDEAYCIGGMFCNLREYDIVRIRACYNPFDRIKLFKYKPKHRN